MEDEKDRMSENRKKGNSSHRLFVLTQSTVSAVIYGFIRLRRCDVYERAEGFCFYFCIWFYWLISYHNSYAWWICLSPPLVFIPSITRLYVIFMHTNVHFNLSFWVSEDPLLFQAVVWQMCEWNHFCYYPSENRPVEPVWWDSSRSVTRKHISGLTEEMVSGMSQDKSLKMFAKKKKMHML